MTLKPDPHWLGALLCLLLISLGATAADQSRLYDNDHLHYWRDRYQDNLQWNFDNLVLGSLNPQERRQLGSARLSLPLRAPGKQAGDPLVFYAADGQVVFPIQSVKFFDDLSLAWAWAWANDRSLENVTDYVAMLKYRQPPAGGFPPPLEALGVAPDAWKRDPRVDDLSQKILKSAMVWIMAHEVGHLLYRHPGYGPGVSAADAQRHEAEADRFANEIMRRIGVAPGGMANFFMMLAHWSPNRGDFDSDASWQRFLAQEATHPFTGARMQAIAGYLQQHARDYHEPGEDRQRAEANVRNIAVQLQQIAAILNDPQIQRSIAAKARANDPAALSYRPPETRSPGPGEAFSGLFNGIFLHRTRDLGEEQLPLQLLLERRGQQVQGRFDFGLGQGSLEGIVVNTELRFQWRWGDNGGRGVLTTNGGDLEGSIGYRQSRDDAGRWQLQRPAD